MGTKIIPEPSGGGEGVGKVVGSKTGRFESQKESPHLEMTLNPRPKGKKKNSKA